MFTKQRMLWLLVVHTDASLSSRRAKNKTTESRSKYFCSFPLVTQMVKSTEGRENSRRKSSSKRRLYVPLGVAHSCFKKSKQNQNVGKKCKRFFFKMLEKSAKDFFFLQPGKYSRNIPRQRNTFKINITRSVCEKLAPVGKKCCHLLFIPVGCVLAHCGHSTLVSHVLSGECTKDAWIIIENNKN